MTLDRRISVAPMMDWTDRHDRYFLRLISKHAVLYTEMVTTGAVVHGDRERLLGFHASEHPVAVQLGGSDPGQLAESARIAEDLGYDEVNLNVGCPSDRVQSGRFGACLMAEPELVADCVTAMRKVVGVPVTVKTRIGIDDRDSYEELHDFVRIVRDAGCEVFIIHARKAWLKGLSPKQNREIPPLSYETVYRLKQDFPELEIHLNGGVKSLDEAERHLQHVDGVMIGREAYHNPFVMAEVDQRFYGSPAEPLTRHQIIERLTPYIEAHLATGAPLSHISRHILGLFHGQPHGKQWRRYISENAHKKGAGLEVVARALQFVGG